MQHSVAPHPPVVPSPVPLLHVTPVTCALWQHSERTPCAGCHGNDLGGPQSVSHMHAHTHSLTHCGKEGDRYSIIRRGVLGGAGGVMRVALQWAHCRDTGEIRERVSVFLSQWQKVCVCACSRENVCVVFEGAPETAICHWTVVPQTFRVLHSRGLVLNAHNHAAGRPFRRALIPHSSVHNSVDFWSMWAIRPSFKIDDPCGI